jgi:pimeloyl-ACP methyl ester carboxylesterase
LIQRSCQWQVIGVRFSQSLPLVLALFSLSGCAAFERRAPNPRISISQLERVTLGGFPQAIRLRGDDTRNPVLLFVHGGPGLPEMPVAHLNADLERDFVVVQWDQRGAGKSYRAHTPGLNAEQVVRDTLELTHLLRQRFGGRKIYLVGYSWGSLVAIRAAIREPQNYAAYVGISQVVDIDEAEATLYREALADARRGPFPQAIHDLEQVGPPPWRTPADKRLAKRSWKQLHPPVPNRMTPARFTALSLTSPAYSLIDVVKAYRGLAPSYAALQHDIYAADLFHEIPRIDLPAWFLMGRHDTVVSDAVLARYFRTLQAPRGKHLVWFYRSNHAPHLEEPVKYRATMREIRRG